MRTIKAKISLSSSSWKRGVSGVSLSRSFSLEDTGFPHVKRTLYAGPEAEVEIPLGDIPTPSYMLIVAGGTEILIGRQGPDASKDIRLKPEEACLFRPNATMYVKNTDTVNFTIIEYLVFTHASF